MLILNRVSPVELPVASVFRFLVPMRLTSELLDQASFVEAKFHGWTGYRTSSWTQGCAGFGEEGIHERLWREQWLWLDAGDRWTGHRRNRVDLGPGSQPAEIGAAPRRYCDREREQPVLLPDRDLYRRQRRSERCGLADSSIQGLIRTS